jgi:putative copper export protein
MWPLVVAIAVFTAWDLLWLGVHDAERNAQEMLDTSTRARTYMSYFVAIYGAGIVFVLPVSDKIDREAVLTALAQSGAPGWLLISPLALCAVAMLFFPIKLGEGTVDALVNRPPTAANVAVVVLNAWIQKVSTFVFVYCLLLIAAFTWSGHGGVNQGDNVPKPLAAQSPVK